MILKPSFLPYTLLIFSLIFIKGIPVSAGERSEQIQMTSGKNILDSQHLGIINHHITCGVPYENVGTIRGFWAPPYLSSDALCELLIDGNLVPANSWKWYPFRFLSTGSVNGIQVESDYLLAANERGVLLKISLTNNSDKEKEIHLSLRISAPHLDESNIWDFPIERSSTPAVRENRPGNLLFSQGGSGDPLTLLFSEVPAVASDRRSDFGNTILRLLPGEKTALKYTSAIGPLHQAEKLSQELASHFDESFNDSLNIYENDLAGIYERLPELESENEAFVRLYNRSLEHFFTNRWEIDEFVLNPYFGTGSILGGCLCCYLWNYGEPWEIIHLYDPVISRKHIKQFLSIDLTKHFAFRPTTGEGTGPWYMINQEKILGHLYYYLQLTGDKSFLSENVSGKPIWEHTKEQCFVKEDPSQPVTLIDYGDSNSHLELRRANNLYNHVMPDLNGRRYDNYMRGAAILDEAGHPSPELLERAEQLKTLLKDELWNPQVRWFDFINGQGLPEIRWTIQIYKLIGSDILDEEETAGLLSHWNENEFLGLYGVHSLAKGDPWFDPADIDNGGPGACTDFGPQIAERFYKAGYPELGNDTLKRFLWLGETMPYWGDSVTAASMDYRKDTPLQSMFDSVTIAQTIIFGTFGISSGFDGTVRISPAYIDFAPRSALRRVKIREKTFDVELYETYFTLLFNGKEYRGQYSETILIDQNGNVSCVPRKKIHLYTQK